MYSTFRIAVTHTEYMIHFSLYFFGTSRSKIRCFIETCGLEKFNISQEWLWVNFYISRKVTSIYSYIQLLKPLQTKSIEIDLKNCSRASSRAKLI